MILKDSIGRSGPRILILLIILSSLAVLLITPASAGPAGNMSEKPFVTILAPGSQSYYLGEKVNLRGQNTESDSTYLFMTGPNLPPGGGNLTSPLHGVVSGNPESFVVVKTSPDKTWEYSFYTANLPLDAGTYTLYAATRPVAENQFGDLTTYGTVGVILKKPFLTAGISPVSISRGQPFAVNGSAEGEPRTVQVWIVGNNFLYNTMVSVNPDASYTYFGDTQLSEQLPKGQCYLIVQHPMQNTQIDILASGDWVKNLQLNEGNSTGGTNLFKIRGPGSLQGNDAAEALIFAIGDHTTGVDDTYTVIPFQVSDPASPAPQASAAATTPARYPTQHAPLQYAPAGAIVLILGIALWSRR
jgi:hypothetical protein